MGYIFDESELTTPIIDSSESSEEVDSTNEE